jgi:DNA-binding transcriptional LysR family regulator
MVGFAFTLRQLEVFEIIRDCRSFRITAEKLGISQAAVSNHLKTLEEQLGVSLLVREPGKRPGLTLQGMAFARDLQPFLAAATVLNGHKRSCAEIDASYRFKVYVGLSLLENYVRPKLDQFLRANPDIDLEFQAETPGPATLRKILEDRFDFALLHLTREQELDEATRILGRCRSGVFAHQSILPQHGRPLTTEEISALPFVLPRAGTDHERPMVEALHRFGIRPTRIVGRTQYFDVLACMVEQGLGAGMLCEAFIRPELRNEVQMAWPFEPFRIVVRRRPGLEGAAARAVEKFLVDSVLDDGRYPLLGEGGDARALTEEPELAN